MPITVLRQLAKSPITDLRERRIRRGTIRDRGRRLHVEIVNNMPDLAVFATQRQFIKLIEEGAREFEVTIGLTMLETIARGDELKRELSEIYRSPAHLAAAAPDAIVFTGAEPRAASLDEEPYWRELIGVFDMARARSIATLASCLAAHALALHLDGLQRRRYAQKYSGLYLTEVVAPHPLTEGLAAGMTPHSRWNGLDESDLTAAGYVVLTRSREAGVDAFAKDDGRLALFFQGHPEYESDTLAREFRRDVFRAVQGAGPAPAPPKNYYASETEARLRAHIDGLLIGTETRQLPTEAMAGPDPSWRLRGGVMIGNWLAEIAARKRVASEPTFLRARFGG